MKGVHWRHWGIRTRLVLIAALPVVYLFCSVALYSYQSRLGEAREELAERARIVAAALAESLAHNVAANNRPGLSLAINGMVQADQSIHRIEVLDAARRPLAQATSFHAAQPEPRQFEAAVRRQLIWVNLLSERQAVGGNSRPGGTLPDTIGYVLVTMSPTNMLDKQTRRFRIELAMAALALAVSGTLALFLARGLVRPLREAVSALRAIGQGEHAARVAQTAGGEVGGLQASINEMAASLQRATAELENKVSERTRDLLASRNEALKADAEKRRLIHKVHSIVEEERKGIAVEIHDELNATLVAARLESQRIQQLAAGPCGAQELEEIGQRARAVAKLTLDLYVSGRSLVRRLRPEVLDMLGLGGAVEEMLRHCNADPAGCRFTLEAEGDFSGLDSGVAISAYRIVQEAVSNVVKHAGASRARVALRLLRGGAGRLEIEVRDDGVGFVADGADASAAAAAGGGGLGLAGMRERVAAFGGAIQIQGGPDGVQVSVALPLPVSPTPSPSIPVSEPPFTPQSEPRTLS